MFLGRCFFASDNASLREFATDSYETELGECPPDEETLANFFCRVLQLGYGPISGLWAHKWVMDP